MKGIIFVGLAFGAVVYVRIAKKVSDKVEEELDSRDEIIELQNILLEKCVNTINEQTEIIKKQGEVCKDIKDRVKKLNRELKASL